MARWPTSRFGHFAASPIENATYAAADKACPEGSAMHTTSKWITVLLAATIALGLSGCASKSSDSHPTPVQPAPYSSSKAPVPTPNPVPAPAKPLPGVAYKESYAFSPNDALVAKPMKMNTDWTKLTITYWQNSTAPCYVMSNDPPEGTSTGAAPKIVFESPVTKTKYEFTDLVSSASCSTGATGSMLKTSSRDVVNEFGQWTVTVKGRGQNVGLAFLVLGD
jgi:hypothetical protein